ncbi:MAG: PhzF family phenazine biosynthesis protein [Planctomycetota bacterium]
MASPAVRFWQVDAFTDRAFGGNPAAVVLVDAWPTDDAMQRVAMEMNLSETAFVKLASGPSDGRIRWFTPTSEVDLCGHATLAAAHVLWNELGRPGERLALESASGPLGIAKAANALLELDFPAQPLEPVEITTELVEALGARPSELYASMDLVAVFENKRTVHELAPNFQPLRELCERRGVRALACVAPGAGHDIVARLFAPAVGIDEDPVTGSAYTMLGPLFAERIRRPDLTAHQVSRRGGELWLRVEQDRVKIAGHAVTTLEGVLRCPL